jgi:hypothetical protein
MAQAAIWLNMAEIELSVLSTQCLVRCIPGKRLGMKARFSRNRSALLRESETPSRCEHFAASFIR